MTMTAIQRMVDISLMRRCRSRAKQLLLYYWAYLFKSSSWLSSTSCPWPCHLPGVTAVLSPSCTSSIRSCLWLISDALWPEDVYIGLAKRLVWIFHSTLWKNPKHEWTFWPAQYHPNLQVLDNCMESIPIQECMWFWNPASPHCRVWAGVP